MILFDASVNPSLTQSEPQSEPQSELEQTEPMLTWVAHVNCLNT